MSRKTSSKTGSHLTVNISLIGHLGSGKSAIVVKYLTRRYIVDYYAELEDKYSKLVNYRGENVLLNIYDTYDKDDLDYKCLLKWSHIILVVYSITSRSSFYRAREILESLTSLTESLACGRKCISLVANKTDMERSRLVSHTEGEQLASEFYCGFQQCTVTEGYSIVENIFRVPVEHYLERRIKISTLQSSSGSVNAIGCPSPEIVSNGSGYRWIRSSSSKTLLYDGSPTSFGTLPLPFSGVNGDSLLSPLIAPSTPVTSTSSSLSSSCTPNESNKKNSTGFRFFKKPK